jgi:hypothetical protein
MNNKPTKTKELKFARASLQVDQTNPTKLSPSTSRLPSPPPTSGTANLKSDNAGHHSHAHSSEAEQHNDEMLFSARQWGSSQNTNSYDIYRGNWSTADFDDIQSKASEQLSSSEREILEREIENYYNPVPMEVLKGNWTQADIDGFGARVNGREHKAQIQTQTQTQTHQRGHASISAINGGVNGTRPSLFGEVSTTAPRTNTNTNKLERGAEITQHANAHDHAHTNPVRAQDLMLNSQGRNGNYIHVADLRWTFTSDDARNLTRAVKMIEEEEGIKSDHDCALAVQVVSIDPRSTATYLAFGRKGARRAWLFQQIKRNMGREVGELLRV